jgi:hypothetical protein
VNRRLGWCSRCNATDVYICPLCGKKIKKAGASYPPYKKTDDGSYSRTVYEAPVFTPKVTPKKENFVEKLKKFLSIK